MRKFHTIVPQNTVGQWVDAFNNNALAAADHTVYLGEILFSSVLYTGLETICGQSVKSRKFIDPQGVYAEEFYFDNWYIYFRNENKIKLVEHQVYDLSDYADNNLYFLFVNSELGYRVSVNSIVQSGDEVRLCRFQIDDDGNWIQIIPTFQRFGYFGGNDHYPEIEGMDVTPSGVNNLDLEDGTITYNNVNFDNQAFPDVLHRVYTERMPILYNDNYNRVYPEVLQVFDDAGEIVVDEEGNQVYKLGSSNYVIEPTTIVNYETHETQNLDINKFSIQRVLYDIYTECLVIQYGNAAYDSMRDALEAVYSADYPFPFTDTENNIIGNAFPMLAVMVIKSDCSDITDPEQCRIVQLRSESPDFRDAEQLASDSYARSMIEFIQNQVDGLRERVTALEDRCTEIENSLDDHINDFNNPHKVNVDQIGLGSFRNPSDPSDPSSPYYGYYTPQTLPLSTPTKQYVDSMIEELGNRMDNTFKEYVRKSGDTMTGALTINMSTNSYGLIVRGSYSHTRGDGSSGDIRNTGISATNVRVGCPFVDHNGVLFFVGSLPAGAPTGSYGVS